MTIAATCLHLLFPPSYCSTLSVFSSRHGEGLGQPITCLQNPYLVYPRLASGVSAIVAEFLTSLAVLLPAGGEIGQRLKGFSQASLDANPWPVIGKRVVHAQWSGRRWPYLS